MSTDLSKSSIEQVLDLIKESNTLAANDLIAADVDFTDLTSLVDHPSGKNTGVTVASKPNSRYVGNVPITYNRLAIEGLSQYGELTISINEGGGEPEILAAINSAYGTNLSFDDITMTNAELVDYDGEIVTFTAKATSLAWLGEIALIVKWNQTALSSILTQSNLNGLHWPIIFQGLIETLANSGQNLTLNTYSKEILLHDIGDHLIAATYQDSNTTVFNRKFNYSSGSWSANSTTASNFNAVDDTWAYGFTAAQIHKRPLSNLSLASVPVANSTTGSWNSIVVAGNYIYGITGSSPDKPNMVRVDKFTGAITGNLAQNSNAVANAIGANTHHLQVIGNNIYFILEQKHFYKFDLVSNLFVKLTNPPIRSSGNQYGALRTIDGRLLALNFGLLSDEVYEYDFANDVWSFVVKQPQVQMYFSSVINGSIYMGKSGTQNFYVLK